VVGEWSGSTISGGVYFNLNNDGTGTSSYWGEIIFL